ncbi:MAG: PrgI family protein [Candidatus Saccharibacteria bacterium]
MKVTMVPAQVTTVEDKVAGNLSMTQLILLASPIFISAIGYAALPPSLTVATYKAIGGLTLMVVCSALAVKLRGRLVLQWVNLMRRYLGRPRYYVSDKNDPYLRRAVPVNGATAQAPMLVGSTPSQLPARRATIAERIDFERLLAPSGVRLAIKRTRKGGLDVSISKSSW